MLLFTDQSFESEQFLFFATKKGVIKKTPLNEYGNIRKGGLIAINLREDDDLIGVKLTDGNQAIVMGTKLGMSIHFPENDVRSMGRSATGVIGIRIQSKMMLLIWTLLVKMIVVVIVTTKGFGKRTPMSEYRIQTRGGKGIKTLNVTAKNGPVVGLKVVKDDEDLMIITALGTVIRTDI